MTELNKVYFPLLPPDCFLSSADTLDSALYKGELKITACVALCPGPTYLGVDSDEGLVLKKIKYSAISNDFFFFFF